MASVEMKIDGVENVSKYLNQLNLFTKKAMDEIVENTAIEVHNIAKKNIAKGSRTGATYKKNRQRSAPGEYPKTDTGELVSSIFWEKRRNYYVVGARALHAYYLEVGTSKMEPRPWLMVSYLLYKPILQKELKNLENEIKDRF